MRCSPKVVPACVFFALFASGKAVYAQTQKLADMKEAGSAGQQIFNGTCAACHGLDGRGGEHAPNIASEPGVQRQSDSQIAGIVAKGIANAGMPAFAGSLNSAQISSVVKYLRSLDDRKEVSSITGDAGRGKALYFGTAHCAECHTVGAQGGFLGPDLSGYGRTHSAGEVREAAIGGSRDRGGRHGMVTVQTRSGKTYTGVLRNEDNFSLQMQTADGSFQLLDKSESIRIDRDPKSFTHANYSKGLSTQQMDDLTAFLTRASGVGVRENDKDEEQ